MKDIEKVEFRVVVNYDKEDPYGSFRIYNPQGHVQVDYYNPFFLGIEKHKLGKREIVKMKIFPHKEGVVCFKEGYRSANVVEFVAFCDKYIRRIKEIIAITESIEEFSAWAWSKPMMYAWREKNDKFIILKERLEEGGGSKPDIITNLSELFFLGVKDSLKNQKIINTNFRVSIDGDLFLFNNKSSIYNIGETLLIVEPRYNNVDNKILKKDSANCYLRLPAFILVIRTSINARCEVWEDQAGHKKFWARYKKFEEVL